LLSGTVGMIFLVKTQWLLLRWL